MRVYSPFRRVGGFVCQPAQGVKGFSNLNHPVSPGGSIVLYMQVFNYSKKLSSSNPVKNPYSLRFTLILRLLQKPIEVTFKKPVLYNGSMSIS